jgi:hypothetical protein
MKSLVIIRATDILELKSTLLEMNHRGLDFEFIPKEINPSSIGKTFRETSDKKYELCALVPLVQDYDVSKKIIKTMPFHSDMLLLKPSDELFNNYAMLMPVLPDLEIPNAYYKDVTKNEAPKEKHSAVYLGVFVNKMVKIETSSGEKYNGILRHADSIGILFEPADNSAPIFITWHDIKKVIIPKEDAK